MSQVKVQKLFEQIEAISEAFGNTLEDFAEDGVIDTEESRLVKQHLITYRDQFVQTRKAVKTTQTEIRAEFDSQIEVTLAAHGEGSHAVARLRMQRYHRLRPFDMLLELTDRMLEIMAHVPRPSFDAAREMYRVFKPLAHKFKSDIGDVPTATDTQTVLAVNVVELQLADSVARWQRAMTDIQARAARADESPLQKVYLKGMAAALAYVLSDVRSVTSETQPVERYEGLLPLDYREGLT